MRCKNCKYYDEKESIKYYSIPKYYNKHGFFEFYKGKKVSEIDQNERKIAREVVPETSFNENDYNKEDIIFIKEIELGKCDKVIQSDHYSNDGIYITASDNYHVEGYVGSDFGCIHFEHKDLDLLQRRIGSLQHDIYEIQDKLGLNQW